MVKGTTRQVLVVRPQESDLFEQAIFLLREEALEQHGVTEQALLEEARRQAGAETRQMLARACAALNIPLVHGAIQGWYAQVAVIPPGCDLLDRLYPAGEPAAGDKSSLAFTPALCAALQASEAVKLLCGRDSPLAGKLLCADLLNQDYEVLSLPKLGLKIDGAPSGEGF